MPRSESHSCNVMLTQMNSLLVCWQFQLVIFVVSVPITDDGAIYVYVCMYSRTSIIQTPVCHLNVKSVQINEFVWISELSDKMYYLASQLYTIVFLHRTVNELRGRPIISYMLICFSTHCTMIYNKPNKSKDHTDVSFITWFYRKSRYLLGF